LKKEGLSDFKHSPEKGSYEIPNDYCPVSEQAECPRLLPPMKKKFSDPKKVGEITSNKTVFVNNKNKKFSYEKEFHVSHTYCNDDNYGPCCLCR
jgi:hypothetical protein